MDKEGLDIAFVSYPRLDGVKRRFDPDSPPPSPAPTTIGCTSSPRPILRMFGITMVAPHDITGSIERSMDSERIWPAIFLRPNHVNKNGAIPIMIRALGRVREVESLP
jgi:hypothetical protein